jgi:predicted RNA-binding protein YlxR (DUF448 family)
VYSRPVQLLLVTLALCSNLTNSPESNVIHTHQKSPTNELNRLQRHPLNPTLTQLWAPSCSDKPARAAYVHHTATSCLAALAALPCCALSKLAARVNAQCITYQDKKNSGDVIVETEFETVGDANLGRGKGEGKGRVCWCDTVLVKDPPRRMVLSEGLRLVPEETKQLRQKSEGGCYVTRGEQASQQRQWLRCRASRHELIATIFPIALYRTNHTPSPPPSS